MKKQILLIIILFLTVAVGSVGLYKISNPQTRVLSAQSEKPATEISVYHAIAADANFPEEYREIKIASGATELDLLKHNAVIKTKGEGKNAFVLAINQREADMAKREFWALYVNGKQAQVGAGSYVLKNGDRVKWQVEKY